MPSYVVRLDDRSAEETFADLSSLLAQWESFGCTLHPLAPGADPPAFGSPTVCFRRDIVAEWATRPAWHRLRWLYYCDDADGITLRVYDCPHFSVYAPSGYYIEPASVSDPNDHYERVIVRGYCMGHEPSGSEQGLRVCRLLHQRPLNLHTDDLLLLAADPLDLLRPDVEVLVRNTTLKLRIRAASKWIIWRASSAPYSLHVEAHPPYPRNIVTPADLTTRLDYFQDPNRNNVPGTPPTS